VASFSTVLVGTDGSESSFRAVDRAAALAGDSGATLHVVSAYRPLPPRERERAAAELGPGVQGDRLGDRRGRSRGGG